MFANISVSSILQIINFSYVACRKIIFFTNTPQGSYQSNFSARTENWLQFRPGEVSLDWHFMQPCNRAKKKVFPWMFGNEEGGIVPGQAKSSFWPWVEWRWHKGRDKGPLRVTGHPPQPPHPRLGYRAGGSWGHTGRGADGRGLWHGLSDRTSTVTITNCAWPASYIAWATVDMWQTDFFVAKPAFTMQYFDWLRCLQMYQPVIYQQTTRNHLSFLCCRNWVQVLTASSCIAFHPQMYWGDCTGNFMAEWKGYLSTYKGSCLHPSSGYVCTRMLHESFLIPIPACFPQSTSLNLKYRLMIIISSSFM